MGAPRTQLSWDSNVQQLDQWWNEEGRSAGWIAARLHITRNSVIGKVNRMGWSNRRAPRGNSVYKKGSPKTRANIEAVKRKGRVQDAARGKIKFSQVDEPYASERRSIVIDVSPDDPPASERVTLELSAGCMWPFEESGNTHSFCNRAKKHSSSYCAEHHRRAYLRNSKRRAHDDCSRF